jgi:hypothetical protein
MISIEDRQFINANLNVFETIEHGYFKDQNGNLNEFTRIYKTYIDPKFHLTSWCPICVFNMMKRLKQWYETQNVPVIETEEPEKLLKELNIPIHPNKANRRVRR